MLSCTYYKGNHTSIKIPRRYSASFPKTKGQTFLLSILMEGSHREHLLFQTLTRSTGSRRCMISSSFVSGSLVVLGFKKVHTFFTVKSCVRWSSCCAQSSSRPTTTPRNIDDSASCSHSVHSSSSSNF